jgi:hypothetical protein
MDRFDRELREQLAKEPLVRNGFDERLRRRIEERLGPERRTPRKAFLNVAGYAVAGLLTVAAVWIGMWRVAEQNRSLADEAVMRAADTFNLHQGTPLIPEISTDESAAIRSAFLLGVRRDQPNPEGVGVVSQYRTMLVAAESGMPQVVAEGSGILMPYGREFWLIRAVPDLAGGQRLVAKPVGRTGEGVLQEASEALEMPDVASEAELAELAPMTGEPAILEQLLFAGNRYVSIRQVTWVAGAYAAEAQERLWVKNVEMLRPDESGKSGTAGEEPHVALSEVLPGEKDNSGREEWAIIREPGRWAVRYPEEDERTVNRRIWRALPVMLPSSVVSHDRLDLGWDQIAQLDPLAKDAYTSPAGDLAALVRSDAIRVVPYRLPDATLRTYTLPLDESETIVMVQWALDRYVDEWKRLAVLLLKPESAAS